jgi:hypothetical protein
LSGTKLPFLYMGKSIWSLSKDFDVVIKSYLRNPLMAEIMKGKNEKQFSYLNKFVVLSRSCKGICYHQNI